MDIKKAIICGLLIGAAVITSGWAAPEKTFTESEYTVRAGDTLWSIAEENCGDIYIMEYMDIMKDKNPGLRENHGQIRAGEVLVIPHES